MGDPLDRLARRAAAEPFFLAGRLADHQAAHDLSDLDLAAELHCTPEALTMLRLCRAPLACDRHAGGAWGLSCGGHPPARR
jgi:hypothetical protein